MFPQIRIPWSLVLAIAVVALTVMASFELADAGHNIANRTFLRPIQRAMSLIW
jgi:hypothetical protein